MTLEVVAPRSAGPAAGAVPFARDLRRYNLQLAVVTPDGSALTYADLADRVEAAALRLGTTRRLVLLAVSPDIDSLVAYLAALSSGHPVLLTAADDADRIDILTATYDPDVVISTDGGMSRWRERRVGTAHELHPELALLLSTSGSTGSPKLVRLSSRNVQSNAESIATYLDIRTTDRAVASLPLHYCYGLSVVNSNLLRGAAVLLTGDSVVDERFWEFARRWGATSLHGVPHTFELFDAVGFEQRSLPSLRYVTQAGGRLDPDRVRRFAELGERRNWRLFVMYGQTEATARMAYLPPELAASHPHLVGIPVPGGSFDLRPCDADDPRVGELVYTGPNVMLGYAQSAADLALGRTVEELTTGDLARRTPDGLYEVVGRRSRFLKLFGLRIDLDHVERMLAAEGYSAACTGTDEVLVVAVTRDADAARDLLRARLGLPAANIEVREFADLPRLDNGKIDYRALDRPTAVREVFARVLGERDVDDDASFVTLGGDSLSYVRASVELEKILGTLPDGWPSLTVRELEQRRRRRCSTAHLRTLEIDIVLRATAILLVVGTHIGLVRIEGGAHLLLALAGWSFARFGLSATDPDGAPRRILRGAVRIAVPAVLWLGFRALAPDDVVAANVALVSNYVPGPVARGYWFIEVLVQTLLLFGVLFAFPAVRRAERRNGFSFALAVLAVALALNVGLDGTGQPFDHAMSTHGTLWFFVLGWLAYRAANRRQRAAVALLALTLVSGYFGDPVRDAVVAGGVLVLLALPRVRIPAPLAWLLGVVAAASLAIYLTHYAIYPVLLPYLPPFAVFAVCVAVGAAVWMVAERCVPAVRKLM